MFRHIGISYWLAYTTSVFEPCLFYSSLISHFETFCKLYTFIFVKRVLERNYQKMDANGRIVFKINTHIVWRRNFFTYPHRNIYAIFNYYFSVDKSSAWIALLILGATLNVARANPTQPLGSQSIQLPATQYVCWRFIVSCMSPSGHSNQSHLLLAVCEMLLMYTFSSSLLQIILVAEN